VIEPVERLCGSDDVGCAREERDLLRSSLNRVNGGQRRCELGPHLVERLDRNDAMAQRDEHARELSGAGAEIDDGEWTIADHPTNGFLRIARSSALVRACDLRERGVRPAHLRIAVDDHPVESRAEQVRIVSTMRVMSRTAGCAVFPH
jgi:hypothetical protein